MEIQTECTSEHCGSQAQTYFCAECRKAICLECYFAHHRECFDQIKILDEARCDICKHGIAYIICLTHNTQICEADYFKSEAHKSCEVYLKNKMSPKIIEQHKQTMNKTIESFRAEKQKMKDAINQKVLELEKTIKCYQVEIEQLDAFSEQYFLQQERGIRLKFDRTGVNSESHKNIQACIASCQQFIEKVCQSLEESKKQILEKLKNVREAREKIVSKQFQPDKIDWIKGEGEIICSNSGMAGNHTLLYFKKKGELYAFGSNNKGQLGSKNVGESITPPAKINNLFPNQKVRQISCGYEYSIILTDQNLYGLGGNQYGQLGIGSRENKSTPSEIQFFKGKQIDQIVCGDDHTLVYSEEFGLYSFGRNDYGQLGIGNETSQTVPQPIHQQMEIGTGNRVRQIQCGYLHTLVLAQEKLFAFGRNEYGQLGIGDSQIQKISSPRDITAQFGGEKITQIAAGNYHSLVLTEKNLYATGGNDNGRLGNGSFSNEFKPCCITNQFNGEKIQEIHCGGQHSIVKTDQGLYSFGYNSDGELGIGSTTNMNTPTKIQANLERRQITQIFCHRYHTIIETNAGILAFGKNDQGQLGNNAAENSLVPTMIDEFLK